MELLSRLVLAVVLTGCYTPDLRDCVVKCTAQTGCADGEACGADGFCAAPGVTCNSEGADASVPPATVSIHIMIMSKGNVILNNTMTCSSDGVQNGNCTYNVPAHQAATVFAMAEQLSHPFMMWTAGCSGALPQCNVTPTANMTISAMFK